MSASIVALLHAEGLIDLDAPVVSILPEFRVRDELATTSISVRHLLTHTAGFDGDIWPDLGEGGGEIDRLVAMLAECAQLSPPGTAFSYNNAAYTVLGSIIERVTGDSFERALTDRVAQACGAVITTDITRLGDAERAIGHFVNGEGAIQPMEEAVGPACMAPAGSRTWSTIDGLLAFGEFHLGRHGTFAQTAALRSMREPQVTVGDPNNGGTMGLGIFLDDRWGTPVVFHDGGVQGQSAYLRVLPKLDTVMAVMSTGGVPQVFHRHVFSILTSSIPNVQAPLGAVAQTHLKVENSRFVGRYEASATRVDISEVNGSLTAEIVWGRETDAPMSTGLLALTPFSNEVFLAPLAGRDYVLVFPPSNHPADHLLAGLRRLNRVSSDLDS
jgi:CubicO group peptidase (beta-lactamase class C family)